ncbi:MAG: hypothetical protein WD969_01900 [Paracoccaceae bacterium]
MTTRHEVEMLDASSDKTRLQQRLHDLSRSRLPAWKGDGDSYRLGQSRARKAGSNT